MRVLIIEDEKVCATYLKYVLQQIRADIQVCAVLPSVEEALWWFEHNPPPELIFSDICLSDGLSFEIFETFNVRAPIIFCSAHQEYSLQAFENNGFDYLLKPVGKERIVRSLAKIEALQHLCFAMQSDSFPKNSEVLGTAVQNSYKSAVLAYYKDKIIPIRTSDIDCLHSEHNIVHVYSGGKKFQVGDSLDNLTVTLDSRTFYRANRQFIINRRVIENIEQFFGRKLAVTLSIKTPEPVVVSKGKASRFLKWVEWA